MKLLSSVSLPVISSKFTRGRTQIWNFKIFKIYISDLKKRVRGCCYAFKGVFPEEFIEFLEESVDLLKESMRFPKEFIDSLWESVVFLQECSKFFKDFIDCIERVIDVLKELFN